MHPIHHTDAFVLRTTEHGEANRNAWLFTREFGLVVAIVQGVRTQGAKLQMQLVEYSFISADLVRGRDTWRLVSVTLVHNPLERIDRPFARGYVRVLTLLSRFLAGVDPHPELFGHLASLIAYLNEGGHSSPRAFDTLALWRTLSLLGYIAAAEHDAPLLTLPFTEAITTVDETTIVRLIAQSNAAIMESQL